MAQSRNIILEGDPILRQQAVAVQRFQHSLHRILDDMRETMYAANGVGLAAPQIGISKCIVVLDDGEHGYMELINPIIVKAEGAVEDVEYCLSVPNRGGVVIRAAVVEVQAQNRYGELLTVHGEGLLARILQHEIDHLHGRIFPDIMIREVRDE